jgi:hypothetical protein
VLWPCLARARQGAYGLNRLGLADFDASYGTSA